MARAGGRGGAHCPPDSAHPSGTLRYRPRDLQGLHDGPEGPALRPRSRRPRAERCSSAGERRSRSGLDVPDWERARRAWAVALAMSFRACALSFSCSARVARAMSTGRRRSVQKSAPLFVGVAAAVHNRSFYSRISLSTTTMR